MLFRKRFEVKMEIVVAVVMSLVLAGSIFADERFKQWDANSDGKLTRNELPSRLRGNFSKVDVNGDSVISLAEHKKFIGRGKQAGRRPSPRVPDNVILKKDVFYAGNKNARQSLDLILPKKRAGDKPLPLLVFIHGGGWRNGSKTSGLGRVMPYLQTGKFVGATIGYRLSGEAKWPAQIHDCKAAIRWLRGHDKKYGFDGDQITVWGTSAGGHLVAMLGVSGDVKDLEGKIGSHLDQSSRVTNVINFFGPSELLTMNDFPSKMNHNAADSPESLLIGGAIQENKEKTRNASPITYVSKDDANILIMHGDKDPLVPHQQSVSFHAALRKADVNSIFVTVAGGGHGFGGAQVDARLKAFLQKYALGQDVVVSSEPIKVGAKR